MELPDPTILVLGVGNPIMGDDGVGIHTVRMLKKRVRPRVGLEFKELGVGGMRLVEEFLGYDEVVLVDSYASEDAEPGRIREFAPEQFEDTVHTSSPHGTNFASAIKLYKTLQPQKIPKRIRIFTVDINKTETFSDKLSSQVERAASQLADIITRAIQSQ